MERDTRGLMLAIGALSPADRATLVKMIRDYLISKGIDPAKYAEKRDEMHDMKREDREEIRDIKKDYRDSTKIKRKEMKERVQQIKSGWDVKTNTKL